MFLVCHWRGRFTRVHERKTAPKLVDRIFKSLVRNSREKGALIRETECMSLDDANNSKLCKLTNHNNGREPEEKKKKKAAVEAGNRSAPSIVSKKAAPPLCYCCYFTRP